MRAVGVDRIVAEADVAKMTLYKHFRSKDDLVAAWLERRDAEWMEWLEQGVARRRGDRLLAVFDMLGEWFAEPGFRGCAFINSKAEVVPGSPADAQVVAHKRRLRAYLRRLALEQGRSDADTLAAELLLLVEGAIVTAAISGEPGTSRTARRAARRLLRRAA